MIASSNRQKGLTLLELMLVMAIGSAILVMGLELYSVFDRYRQMNVIRSNVEMIFDAMNGFYRATCNGMMTYNAQTFPSNPANLNEVATPWPGVLNPTYPGGFTTPFYPYGNPSTLLYYFQISPYASPTASAKPGSWPSYYLMTFSPYVDISQDSKTPAYVAEFVEFPAQQRYSCGSGGCVASKIPVGTVINWQERVGVRLIPDTNNMGGLSPQVYLGLLGGDCLGTYTAKDGLSSCGPGGSGSGDYVIWARAPSVNRVPKSDAWLSTHQLILFQQLYTTYPLNYQLSTQGRKQNVMGLPQYYLCGDT